MADVAPGSLGDFFAKKKKKAAKSSNLNNESSNPKAEEKKKPIKEKEEEGWEEEQIAVTAMKVEVAGKLTKEDEKKEEEDTAAPAWRNKNTTDKRSDLNEKRYPTLAKAVAATGRSSNINIDDGSTGAVNIKTSKNAFAALHDNDDDEDEGPKRPKEIRPAMVQKQKGERTSTAVQREVEKYSGPADDKKDKPKRKKKKVADEDEDEEDEEPAEDAKDKKKKKKESKQAKDVAKQDGDEDEGWIMEDAKIEPDLEASRRKYQGRKKMPRVELPKSELEEEKVSQPKSQPAAGGKKGKKKMFMEEELEKPKLLVADWD